MSSCSARKTNTANNDNILKENNMRPIAEGYNFFEFLDAKLGIFGCSLIWFWKSWPTALQINLLGQKLSSISRGATSSSAVHPRDPVGREGDLWVARQINSFYTWTHMTWRHGDSLAPFSGNPELLAEYCLLLRIGWRRSQFSSSHAIISENWFFFSCSLATPAQTLFGTKAAAAAQLFSK